MKRHPHEPQTPDIDTLIGETTERSRKKRRGRYLFFLILFLLAIGSGFLIVGKREGDTVSYVTQKVETGDLTIQVTASGTLKPTNQVDISSELSGTVKTVSVDFNDQVKAGQVLARLDTSTLEARVMQAKAALLTAEAKQNEAGVTLNERITSLDRLKKLRRLSGNKAMSESDIEAAEANLARARAQLSMTDAQITEAKANLMSAETDLGKAVIYSPIDGIVLSRTVEPGQTVASSLQAPVLFTLAEDLKKMELHVDVDEADVGAVREAQKAVFTVDAYPGKNFPAHISQVRYAAQTVGGVVTYETLLTVDNTGLLLRPGMTATADIVVKKLDQILLVPNAALRFTPVDGSNKEQFQGGLFRALMPRFPGKRHDQANGKEKEKGKSRVWILKEGAPVSIAITTGETDGRMTQILEGDLSPGMAVVTDATTGKVR
jgi:HlyD family secretion protein